jgi:hypothetical protein
MKSYSGQKRTLLKFKNGAGMLGKVLQNPELVAAINADKSTVTQSFKMSFNEPTDPMTEFSARYNLFGPETSKWTEKAHAFRTSKGSANPSDGERVLYVKYEISNTAVDSWNELKPIIDEFVASPAGEMVKAQGGLCFDITHSGEKLIIEFSIMPRELAAIEVPGEIAEALAEVENYVEVNLKLATSPGEIMKSEKAISECLLGGFAYSVDLTYFKNIKKVGAVLPEKAAEICSMLAPAFKLGVKANINLTFEDAEDIKEHPMVGDKFDMKFDDLFGMIGQEKATFADYELDISELDESKVKDADPQVQMMFMALKASNIVSKLLKGFTMADGSFTVEADVVLGGVMHAEV